MLLHNDLLKLSNQLPPIPPSVAIADNDHRPPRKKARRVLDDTEGSGDEAVSEAATDDKANASVDEDTIDTDGGLVGPATPDIEAGWDMSDASDTGWEPESGVSSARRKRPTETDTGSNTYDLEQLAQDGHGGRVLFVFEKIAKARFE